MRPNGILVLLEGWGGTILFGQEWQTIRCKTVCNVPAVSLGAQVETRDDHSSEATSSSDGKRERVFIWVMFLKVINAKPRLKEVISLLFAFLFEEFICIFAFLKQLFQSIITIFYALAG